MNLPQNEIDERIEHAIKLYNLHLDTISYYKVMKAVDDIDEEYIYYYLIQGYEDTFNTELVADQLATIYDTLVSSEIETMLNGDDLAGKALFWAENDTNVIDNYLLDLKMAAQGYTRKRWDTMRDNHVRPSHVKADGQEVDIYEPFVVGDSLMLYPKDILLGASLKEIIGCRCVCHYLK